MVRSIVTLGIAALATVADATTVAILEFGKGGTVHSTGAPATTSSHGVMSFWRSIHEAGSDGQPGPAAAGRRGYSGADQRNDRSGLCESRRYGAAPDSDLHCRGHGSGTDKDAGA